MRPKLNWDGYTDAHNILHLLTFPLTVEILRMIASNAYGMTEQQVWDNSHYPHELIETWLQELYLQGFVVKKQFPINVGQFTQTEVDYYQCNWKQIKRVNKAISQL